jgi:HEPN domain-containing protein
MNPATVDRRSSESAEALSPSCRHTSLIDDARMSLLLLLKPHGPPYHRFLLDTAQRLFESGHYAPAIVTAQMACEIATEQAISAAYRRRGIEDLDEPIGDLFQSLNLGNERLRRLYVALTHDPIHEQPFWQRFTEHATRRHRVIHRGQRASKNDAEASISAAAEFVEHLEAALKAGP